LTKFLLCSLRVAVVLQHVFIPAKLMQQSFLKLSGPELRVNDLLMVRC
jgi:hypothetical protein